ncbi:hypothetical protein CMUS01_02797 [Colletotrichum musicola]|uniref:Uncharacterized protein n=1 Tax=Colletotrichum musicola TaxID=2175873 RepID=A0A8H6U799_9PEZI|nr:hypothetical protein CMUS01_02797 [Colletotrichum musicola]
MSTRQRDAISNDVPSPSAGNIVLVSVAAMTNTQLAEAKHGGSSLVLCMLLFNFGTLDRPTRETSLVAVVTVTDDEGISETSARGSGLRGVCGDGASSVSERQSNVDVSGPRPAARDPEICFYPSTTTSSSQAGKQGAQIRKRGVGQREGERREESLDSFTANLG